MAGPTLRFLAPVRLAVTGADLGAVLQRDGPRGRGRCRAGAAVLARPGNVLAFTGRRAGCRAYVALAGGIDVPVVLGSRSTDLGAGFGGLEGRALRAGDVLGAVAARAATRPPAHRRRRPPNRRPPRVRVVLGPQDDHFAAEARRALPVRE